MHFVEPARFAFDPAAYGFTLIELMVTLAVSAILLTGVIPMFENVINDTPHYQPRQRHCRRFRIRARNQRIFGSKCGDLSEHGRPKLLAQYALGPGLDRISGQKRQWRYVRRPTIYCGLRRPRKGARSSPVRHAPGSFFAAREHVSIRVPAPDPTPLLPFAIRAAPPTPWPLAFPTPAVREPSTRPRLPTPRAAPVRPES